MLKLLKSNHPFVFIFIPLLTALFWAPSLIFGSHEFVRLDTMVDTPLYSICLDWLGTNFYLHKSIAFVLFVTQAYLLMRLNFKYIFIETKTYLPSVLFVIGGSVFPYFQNLHPLLIANVFLLFALERCFEIRKERNQFQIYFETGFILGLGGLFYFPLVIFLLIVWITQFVLRTFSIREWFSSILGFITPILIYVAILYLSNKFFLVTDFVNDLLTQPPSDIELRGVAMYSLLFVGFIVIISFLYDLGIVGARKISTRKYFILTFWLLIISFFAKLFLPYVSTAIIYVFAIPTSLFLTMYFVEVRSRFFAEIIFLFLLLGVVTSILFQLNVFSI